MEFIDSFYSVPLDGRTLPTRTRKLAFRRDRLLFVAGSEKRGKRQRDDNDSDRFHLEKKLFELSTIISVSLLSVKNHLVYMTPELLILRLEVQTLAPRRILSFQIT